LKPAVPAVAASATSASSLSFIEQVRRSKEPRVQFTPEQSRYVNLAWIPPTTNVVERFFSKLKLVFSERRKSLLPKHIEMLLMLSFNHELWDVTEVGAIYAEQSSQDEDDDDLSDDDDEGEE
jgi:hypothetical protein